MKQRRFNTPRSLWVISVAASSVLLGIVIFFADVETVLVLARQVPWPMLVLGVGVLLLEGVCTALRIKLMTREPTSLRDAVIVAAWWVLGLVTLPARLGELAGIYLLRQRLGQSFGEGLNNLSVQRLLDMAILFAIGAVAVAAQAGQVESPAVVVLSAVLGLLVLAALMNLAAVFGVIARVLLPGRRRRGLRTLLRVLLQARRAARTLLTRKRLAALAVVSVAKWTFNLGGLGLVVIAFAPALSILQGLSIAVVYNLAAVIPLQTVGGVGVGELSLAAGLAWYGYGAATAASAAILMRLVVIGAPVLFWFVAIVLARVTAGAHCEGEASTAP